MSKGKRYNNESKLNIKKVVAVIIAIAVIVMFVIVIQKLLESAKEPKNNSVISYYPVYSSGKWGVIDSLGNTIIPPSMDEMITIPDNKTDIFINTYDVDYNNNTYKTKVLNAKQKQIFEKYDTVEAIENHDKNNILWYETGVLKVKKGDKYGLIDKNGKEILPVEYTNIQALIGYKNSLLLTKEDMIGLCDTDARIIVPTEYKEIKGIGEDYRNGYIVGTKEGTYGIIDFNKKVILENTYEDIKPITGNYMYVVKQEGAYQIIDADQKIIVDGGFDDVTQINKDSIIYTKDGKQGVMNFAKESIIKPQYDNITSLFSDYYIVKKAGKYGILSINETVLPTEYTNITYRKEADFIEVEKENATTTQILDNTFQQKLSGIISEVNIAKGYIRMRIEDSYQYYNFKFEEKTPQEVLTGNTIFLSKKDGKYGYIDKKGDVIVDYQYEDGLEQNEFGYVAVKKDGKWGALDKNGKTVAENKYPLESNVIIDFIGKWHLAEDINSNYYTDDEN